MFVEVKTPKTRKVTLTLSAEAALVLLVAANNGFNKQAATHKENGNELLQGINETHRESMRDLVKMLGQAYPDLIG